MAVFSFMYTDEHLFLLINNFFSDAVSTFFFTAVTHLGNGWVQAAFALPLMYFFSRDKFKKHLLPMAVTAAIGGILVAGIKQAADRQRPPGFFQTQGIEIHTPAGRPDDPSFPSGHTETAFSTATYLSFLYPFLTPVFMIAALFVAVSRVAIGVHFPFDVLAGALTGIAAGSAGYFINKKRLK